MTFKLKLIFVVVFEVILVVAVAGFLGYRESKWEIKSLASDLLVAKTEQAFALCDRQNKISGQPSDELMREVSEAKITESGYMTIIGHADDLPKGLLIVHPTSTGQLTYNQDFPHVIKILDDIDKHERQNGYGNFIEYRQGTDAQGRQGEKKIGYFKYFAPWGWVILSSGYEKDVFASRDKLRKTLVQIMVLVLFVGVVIIYITIRQMLMPVERLTASTKQVAKGNWDVSMDYDSDDEIGTLSKSFNQMVQSLRENARIWQEFNIAKEMQSQMLPEKCPDIAGVEISATSIPAKEVGGDFYDFLDMEDGRTGIVVGDVSGHGVSAAMVMTAAMSAVRFAAEDNTETHTVLNTVNGRMNKDIQDQMFVALFFGIYEPATRRLHYTNAGQTMPYLYRDGEIEFLPQSKNGDRFPLGIVRTTVYEQLQVQLQPGDILIFYTDGIVDAMNGSYENYGFDRFSESILQHVELNSDDMLEKLVFDMRAYSRENSDFFDDVTVLIVKVTS